MSRSSFVAKSGVVGICLFLATVTSAQHLAEGGASTWKMYVNVRYRYQICYPAMMFKPEGEAANNDGQSFKASDGGEFSVFGRNNVEGYSLAQTVKSDAADLTGPHGRISYHAAKPGWEVVSGDNGGSGVFYSKSFQRGDQFVVFELKYPKIAESRYRPVIERLSRCFALTH